MKFRGTWIALVLAVGLGSFVLWSRQRERSAAEARSEIARLVPIAAADVAQLGFSYGDTQIRLELVETEWVITHPMSAACEAAAVAAFLDTLVAARIEQNLGGGDLVRYGLDHPAAHVEIVTRDDKKHRLRFGRINPLQTLVYVLVDDGNDVKLTTSSLMSLALTTSFGWRDKRMIDVAVDSVARIRFAYGASSLNVRHDAEAGWVTDGEVPWRVDPTRMRSLALQLASLRAIGVEAENKQNAHRLGLGNRLMSAILEDGTGRVLGDLTIGGAMIEGAYFAVVPDKPEIFQMEGHIVDTMLDLVREPRDRRMFPAFDPAMITRLDVDAPEDSFIVERRGRSRWVVTASDKTDSTFALDPGRVQELLEKLATLEVSEFPAVQPGRSAVDPAEWRVDLYDDQGLVSGVRIGRRDPKAGLHVFAQGVRDRAVFLVSPAVLIQMPFDLERLGTGEVELPVDAERG